jgi:hypothetical protein
VSAEPRGAERRKSVRRAMRLPVSVRGHTRDGTLWEETSNTTDVGQGGVGLTLVRPMMMGQVVLLALPLPSMLRRYDATAASYRVWSLVRYAGPEGPPHRVGLMFFGRNPPRGYEKSPGGLFFLPSDPQPAWAVQRTFTRHELTVTVRLHRLDEACSGPRDEVTVTEDVSLGGAKVHTTLPVAKGELVQLEEASGTFRAPAVVHNVSTGADGIRRLNLQFMDEEEAAAGMKDLLLRHGIVAG